MKYGSDLTYDDGAGIDLLAAVNLYAPPLGVAVSSIPGASLPLLVCHNLLRLNGYFFDPHTRQLLAVSGLFTIAFSFLHLENGEFCGLGQREDLARDLCAFHHRPSDVKLAFLLNHQNLIENNRIALIAVDLFYGDHVSFGDLVLLTACFDYCIHGSYPCEKNFDFALYRKWMPFVNTFYGDRRKKFAGRRYRQNRQAACRSSQSVSYEGPREEDQRRRSAPRRAGPSLRDRNAPKGGYDNRFGQGPGRRRKGGFP